MVEIPERINLASFYLDRNLELGRGDKTAVYYRDQKFSYAQLVTLSNKVGNVLKDLGVSVEDRVLLALNDSPEFVAGWYGIVKIGAVATDVYTYLHSDDYAYFLNYTRAKVAIVDAATLLRIQAVAQKSPFLKHLIVVGGGGSNHLDFYDLVDRASAELTIADTHADDVALWKFTSGSTGNPKGVLLTHRNTLYNYHTYGRQVLKLKADDIILSVPKLFFGYARDISILYAFAAGAAAALLSERSTADRILDNIEKFRPTVLVNVPTMINAMIRLPEAKSRDVSSLKFCTSSGEALPEALYQAWLDTFGVEVLNCIGSCELCHVYISNHRGSVKPGSMGQLVPGYEAKIVDDKGQVLPHGQDGVLWVKGDSQALRYWQAYHKSRQTFRGPWVNSGDLFRCDREGYFWFVGRGGDVLKVGGIFVAPLQVENCLLGHAAVKEAAVIGARDDQGLIKPKAFIVVKQAVPATPELAAELQRYVKTHLAPYKYPRWVAFLDELPKDNNGKVRKRALSDLNA